MNEFPNELKVKILEECQYLDCMAFRATSSKNYDVGNYALSRKQSFDFRHFAERKWRENEKKKRQNLIPKKMINFVNYMPNLQKIVLADLPCVFELADMIALGKAAPQLKKFVIIQTENSQWIGKEAFLGLVYFERLVNLKISGWEPASISKKGWTPYFETIPHGTLQKLVTLTIACRQETVSKVLQHILDNGVFMKKCVKAKVV
uniref:F-box domain-containing protein n=1 Tax=Caenorhabditis japonica TaxID=281687 RepID=A0A8R1HM14_CAEJA